jgi:hypothetical protein
MTRLRGASMTDGDPMRDAAREYKRPTAATRPDVPVAGLLRDAIVGITCFPDPLPKGRKRSSRRWWLHPKRP